MLLIQVGFVITEIRILPHMPLQCLCVYEASIVSVLDKIVL